MTTTDYSDDMTSLTSTSCEEISPGIVGGGDGLKSKVNVIGSDVRYIDKRPNRKSKKITKIGINLKNIKNSSTTSGIKTKIPCRPSLTKLLDNNNNQNKIKSTIVSNKNLKKEIIKDSKILILKAEENKEDITKYLSPIKQFNCKKSFSQMDMQQVRSSSSRRSRQCESMKSVYSLKPIINDGENRFDRTIELNDDYQFYFSKYTGDGYDNKLAGMKIFATIMLNAWRRRRDDVKKLSEELGKSKKGNIKLKTQIHVLNSLFKIEQKQNDELNGRIRKLLEDQNQIQHLYDHLNIKALELRSRNVDLDEKIYIKDKQINCLENALNETKIHLYQSASNISELNEVLGNEKNLVIDLETKKNELLDVISELKCVLYEKETTFQETYLEHSLEIKELKECIEKLELQIEKYKWNEVEVAKLEKFNSNQKKVIGELTEKLAIMQYQIDSYLPIRIKKLLLRTLPSCIVRYMHLIGYYLLPAVPAPNKDNSGPLIGLQKISCMWKE